MERMVIRVVDHPNIITNNKDPVGCFKQIKFVFSFVLSACRLTKEQCMDGSFSLQHPVVGDCSADKQQTAVRMR